LVRGCKILVQNIIIICENSPIGKNSALESIRMGAGISAVGDLNSVKIVFIGDSVLILSKNYNPKAVSMDENSNIFRMLELADIEVYVLDNAMKNLAMGEADLLDYDNIHVINVKELAEIILEADAIYNY
jgi:sulfur relay (sulfurtransferase) DsrF/TusC family protein